MKRALIVAGFLFASISSAQAVQCVVQGYYKSNGTWVNSYVREQTSCKTTQYAGLKNGMKVVAGLGALLMVAEILRNTNRYQNAYGRHGLDEGDIENVDLTPGAFDTQTLSPVQVSAPVATQITQCPAGQKLVDVWTREKGTVSSCQ